MPRASKTCPVQKAGISFIDRMTQSHPINKRNSLPVRASSFSHDFPDKK
ncbi:hypothetical protein NC99_19510 [Sunxiuqinia dokdonensis]|uniref:Uncharacterized protein n=1 Tax=Sunxiuqinia dokdonensis TaxID=1409788 RepID=A0A0L8VA04_9BACT|nr:hypothetical protein NC99_19510 [Sunxiuqinia dokdonensis]